MRVIEVLPYSPAWPALFEGEAGALRGALDGLSPQIHHIGSTSVPQLSAKPVIDLLVEVEALEALDGHDAAMVALGYEPMGEFGIPERRFYRKGGEHPTHHVHAFRLGSSEVRRHLAFRDYLRAHPQVAADYAAVKRAAARECGNDIERYGELKGPFVQEHEQRALRWWQDPTHQD